MPIKSRIRTIPNFPKEGILFKDITPIFSDPSASKEIISFFAEELKDDPQLTEAYFGHWKVNFT